MCLNMVMKLDQAWRNLDLPCQRRRAKTEVIVLASVQVSR